MNLQEVMLELETLGTEQNRKIFRKHGGQDPMFGVSFANFKILLKKIKKDHELAKQLWATGNYDARIFAAMIADPTQATDELLESWAGDLDSYPVAAQLVDYVSKTTFIRAKAEQWMKSTNEFIGQAGWNLLGRLAYDDFTLADSYFESYFAMIERDIHESKNRTRAAMNNAVIALGSRGGLREQALLTAHKIGKVYIDHGETGCKTPDAAQYIMKNAARKQGEPAK